MNLGQLAAQVYRDTGFQAGTPDVQTRVYAWINEGHRRVLREPSFSGLRQIQLTFTSEAGRPYYGLPQAFEHIDNIVLMGQDRRLQYMTLDRTTSIDPGQRSSGVPDFWGGPWWAPVMRLPPSDGEALWVNSTDPADTTQTVQVQIVRQDGDPQPPATVLLQGQTVVTLPAGSSVAWFDKFTLSAPAVGTVTLWDGPVPGTSHQLSRIATGRTDVQYQVIRLWPTPADVYTFTVQGLAQVTDLAAATDIPLLPPSYHDLLSDYARMREYERTQDTARYGAAKDAYDTTVLKLKAFVEWPADYRPFAGSGARLGGIWPNLPGGYYPADFLWAA